MNVVSIVVVVLGVVGAVYRTFTGEYTEAAICLALGFGLSAFIADLAREYHEKRRSSDALR